MTRERERTMEDLLYVVMLLSFFGICIVYTYACGKL
jgi:hypothetical protein